MNPVTQYQEQGIAGLGETTSSLAVQLAQVEIDSAVSTAKKFPRSLVAVKANITDLVMLDAETAEECVYAVPRAGQSIRGPSVRFAEIVVSQYGNCTVASRVVEVNRIEKYIETEGVFMDLQTGTKRVERTRRRIADKSGRVFGDDMIIVTGNAARSISTRDAILKGVPKALWRAAYDAAEQVICGDVKTLSERRTGAIQRFATFGVTADQIFASLNIAGIDDIGLDQIGTLTAMFKAIKSGEQQVEDYFPAKAKAADGVEAAKGTAGKLSQIAKSSGPKTDAPPPADQDGHQSEPAGEGATGEASNDVAEPTEDEKNDAYNRGYDAREGGATLAACPKDIRDNPALHVVWQRGWKDADKKIADVGEDN